MGVIMKIIFGEKYGGMCTDFIWVHRRTDGETVRTLQLNVEYVTNSGETFEQLSDCLFSQERLCSLE
jgi:hypothetical protein